MKILVLFSFIVSKILFCKIANAKSCPNIAGSWFGDCENSVEVDFSVKQDGCASINWNEMNITLNGFSFGQSLPKRSGASPETNLVTSFVLDQAINLNVVSMNLENSNNHTVTNSTIKFNLISEDSMILSAKYLRKDYENAQLKNEEITEYKCNEVRR